MALMTDRPAWIQRFFSRPKPPQIHRNITFQRLALDFYHYLRVQGPCTRWLGHPFEISRQYIEIDITYRCNLACANCNRSCTQSPSRTDLPVEAIAAFIEQSLARGIRWKRVRLLGGEPTLHPEFFAILKGLLQYRQSHNPDLRLVVCTNGHGKAVKQVLSHIPPAVVVKNSYKTSARQRLFRPFNRAPRDSVGYRLADFSAGCRILSDCGIGLTPMGYYPCAIAGGIDRILGFRRGRKALPQPLESLRSELPLFCPMCGHFGFSWPTKTASISESWQQAYLNAPPTGTKTV